MDLKNVAWVEKYRPKTIDNIVGDFRNKLKQYIKAPESIPNFLFYSKTPGTGKTSAALAIINELKCDSLLLNASDDRTLETVRTKIKDFALTQSSNNKKKCCFLDEFDGNLKATQEAMRNFMETYSSNVFFILTCNNIEKVIEPIQSRCVTIKFSFPDKKEIYTRLEAIAKNETLNYTEAGLNKLIGLNYPNIRNCINIMQDIYIENKELNEQTATKYESEFENVWKLLKDKKYNDIKKYIFEKNVDCETLNHFLFEKVLTIEMPIRAELNLIQLIAKIEKDIKIGSDASIIMLSNIPLLIKAINET